MKTKEFIKEVEAMGFEVIEYETYISVNNPGGSTAATVSKEKRFRLDVEYCLFYELSDTRQQQLFNLLTEYASTPIKEREEEKKYMYRVRTIEGMEYFSKDGFYLAYVLNTSMYDWDLIDDTEYKCYQVVFTHSELESLGMDIEQLKEVYEEIEVEE